MSDSKKAQRRKPGKSKVSMATVQAFGEATKAPGPFSDLAEKSIPQEGGGVTPEVDTPPSSAPVETPAVKPESPPKAPPRVAETKETTPTEKTPVETVRKCSASVYLTESEKMFVDRTAFDFQSTKFPRRSVSFGTIIRAFTQYMIENPGIVDSQLEPYVESILKEVSDGKVRV